MGPTIKDDRQPHPCDIPAWVRPRLLSCLTTTRITTFNAGDVEGRLLLPADPKRFAILFISQSGSTFGTGFAPWSDADTYPVVTFSATPIRWVTLWDVGALVTWQWYQKPASLSTLRVVEYLTPFGL